MGALFRFQSGSVDQETRERDTPRRSRDFTRLQSVHNVAFFPTTRETERIQKPRHRDLARSRRRAGHRTAIAIVVEEKRIRSALGCAAHLLSSSGRLHGAMAVRFYSSPSLAIARARTYRWDAWQQTPRRPV